jgi:hypothetical protein
MSLQYSTEVKRVEVLPTLGEYSNVVKRVIMEITFTDSALENPVESKMMMVALLSTDDMEGFMDISEVTESQIKTWAYDFHGGEENFIGMVSQSHTEELSRRNASYGLQKFDLESQQIVDTPDEFDDMVF